MRKILVVDNDPFILEFLKNILAEEGHEVLTARDGLHAVDVLDVFTPDIIFVDLVMPNIDGKRLCKIIRAMGKLEGVYLVVLSATLEEERGELEALGVDQCIAKGSLESMRENVISAVERRDTPRGMVSIPKTGREAAPAGPRSISEELFSIKKHFEVIFERMRDGIVEISADRRVVYANPAAIRVMGLPEENILASPVTDLFPDEYRPMVLEIISTVDGSPENNREEMLVSMNGYQLKVKALAVSDGGGSLIVILSDVTVEKEAEEALKRRNRELELLNVAGPCLQFQP